MALGLNFGLGLSPKIPASFLSLFPNVSAALSALTINKGSDSLRIRRSINDDESDLTPSETTNGTALAYVVPTDVQTLYRNNGVTFNGLNTTINYGDVDVLDYDDGFKVRVGKFSTSSSDVQILVGKGGSLGGNRWLVYMSGGKVVIRVDDGANSFLTRTSSTYIDGVARFLEVDFDFSSSTGMKIYIDGSEAAYDRQDDPQTIGTLANTNNLKIGSQDEDGFFFSGKLGNVSVLNLSDTIVFNAVGDGVSASNWNSTVGSFPATVTGAALGDYSRAMYFDGSTNLVKFGNVLDVADKTTPISISYTVIISDALVDFLYIAGKGLAPGTAGYCLRSSVPGQREKLAFFISDGINTREYRSATDVFTEGGVYEIDFSYNGDDTISATVNGQALTFTADGVGFSSIGSLANSEEFSIGGRESDSAGLLLGTIYDISVSLNSVLTSSWDGGGNTDANWEDQTGSNDGTVVGSPALFTGQGFNGLAPISYDQRVSTAADRMYFDGVDDYINLGAGDPLSFNGCAKIGAKVKIVIPNNPAAARDIFYNYIDGNNAGFSFDIQTDGSVRVSGRSDGVDGFENFISTEKVNIGEENTIEVYLDHANDEIGVKINDNAFETGAATFANSVYTYGSTTNNTRIGNAEELSRFFEGTVYDLEIYKDDVLSNQWSGYGNTDADWEDQVGSNDGTVNGSPSRCTPSLNLISRDFTQTTAANQPLIVDNGALVTVNNKPILDFNGTTHYMSCPADRFITPTTELQVHAVVRNDNANLSATNVIISQFNSTGDERCFFLGFSDAEKIRLPLGDPSDGTLKAIIESDAAVVTDEIQVVGFTYNAGTVVLYRNGAIVASSTITGTVPLTLFDSSADALLGVTLDGTVAGFWDGQIGATYIADNLDDDPVAIQLKLMEMYGI